MPAPEGSVERKRAREIVVRLTETVLFGGNMSAEEWRDKLSRAHPQLIRCLSEQDVETIIAMTLRQLALYRGAAGH